MPGAHCEQTAAREGCEQINSIVEHFVVRQTKNQTPAPRILFLGFSLSIHGIFGSACHTLAEP